MTIWQKSAFIRSELWRHQMAHSNRMYLHTKLGVDISKGGRVMAIYVFSKWWPLPSWIYFQCQFLAVAPNLLD